MSWEPIINERDPNVNYGDVYLLNYYGELIFFQICEVKRLTVKVVELATKKGEEGIGLYDDLRVSKKPYFVKNNTITKSDYEIELESDYPDLLPIFIGYWSPLYYKVMEKGETPISGIFYAAKLTEYKNIYFVAEEKGAEA